VRWLLVLLGGCVVVRPPFDIERPQWHLTKTDESVETDCVSARALVRKSGKQGIGLTIALRSRRDCDFTPTQITLAFRDGGSHTFATPPPTTLRGRSLLYAWYPLAFDNNAAWNDDHDVAALTIAYTVEGKTHTWQLAMEQR
jgi:hypothetical protein